MSYQKEPGDWTCNHCGKSNFKKRSSCFGCQKSKYYHSHANSSQPGESSRESSHRDWMCPICNFKIYGSKKRCKKCNTKRPSSNDVIVTPEPNVPPNPIDIPREGDWTCPKCTDYQFAKNKFCRSCGTPNPENDTTLANLESTDECVICMDNPKNATLIHGDCGHSCCCLECAKSLHANGGDCPICRRSIEKVIQNFTI